MSSSSCEPASVGYNPTIEMQNVTNSDRTWFNLATDHEFSVIVSLVTDATASQPWLYFTLGPLGGHVCAMWL